MLRKDGDNARKKEWHSISRLTACWSDARADEIEVSRRRDQWASATGQGAKTAFLLRSMRSAPLPVLQMASVARRVVPSSPGGNMTG